MSTPSYLEHYRAAFESFLATRSGEPDWMTELRRSAFANFEDQRLPSRKVEEWKYTSLRGFANETFAPLERGEKDVAAADYEPIATLTCTDGELDLGQSDLGRLDPDVAVRPLGEAWDQARPVIEQFFDGFQNGFAALVAAFVRGGAVIDVGRDVQLKDPIEFVRQTSTENAFGSTLCIIHARRLSEAAIVERCVGDNGVSYFSGGMTYIDVEEGSSLDHVIIQRESDAAYRYAITRGKAGRDAQLRTFNASIGSKLSRDDLDILIDGEGAHVEMGALYLGRDKQHLDHWTRVDHAVPHTTSDQLYKTVLDDKSHGAFAGTVVVRRDAQKVNAEQLNNNLLLTDQARIDTKPQLVIGADDVECGHGATIGQINEEELFYMETRGLTQETARRFLINGYAAEVVERVANDRVRDSILKDVREILYERL
jgi:Fe-S cluster assembly protein SufD